jgi:hypothetical protein
VDASSVASGEVAAFVNLLHRGQKLHSEAWVTESFGVDFVVKPL